MKKEFDYIIVGAGLSGLALAKELSKKNRKILVLEKGNFLRSLGDIVSAALFYDTFALARSIQGTIIYRVFGVGGTSIVSCGNAVGLSDKEIDEIGIDFREELDLAKEECSVDTKSFPVGRASKAIMDAANNLGYDTRIMPKFGGENKCVSCGNCVFGCKYGAKWTGLEFLKGMDREQVEVIPRFSVRKVLVSNGKAIGAEGAATPGMRRSFFADKVILCAGGIGTPIILQNSGVEAGEGLFLDLFNVTYGAGSNFNQAKEVAMAVVCDKFRENNGFILSPFIDNIVSFIPSVKAKDVRNVLRRNRLLGIMTKIKDESNGKVHADGRIDKAPTQSDLNKLRKGSEIAEKILIKCGIKAERIFATNKPRGAHPGGTAAIGRVIDKNLETNIKNLYVCDASALPVAPGLPSMLTLIALSKWFAKNVLER